MKPLDACPRPLETFPTRVPLKVIGRHGELIPEAIAELVAKHLGPQPEADQVWTSRPHGAYIAHSFWVTLPDENAELPLRTAIQALPGYVMQL
ncbi:MAG: DUF493 domain-containing protein [Firmicutes bacterium]|nr:DUF493 domain-containing protein [Bacillota bacterium]